MPATFDPNVIDFNDTACDLFLKRIQEALPEDSYYKELDPETGKTAYVIEKPTAALLGAILMTFKYDKPVFMMAQPWKEHKIRIVDRFEGVFLYPV